MFSWETTVPYEQQPWEYLPSKHKCPACETVLHFVTPSTMLVCMNDDCDSGPYYLT